MPHESHPRRVRPCATMALLVAAMLAACGTSAGDTPGAASAAASEPYRGYTLTLIGMNYTRRYIDTFTVDGRGGGNLRVSSPTSGGGGSACCIGWDNRRTLPVTMTVRWQSGACKVMTGRTWDDGSAAFRLYRDFEERKVQFNGPVPANPQYFVVHIFEDDHVELSMSEDYPVPKLKLSQDREDLTPYPICKDGQYGS
jgi:hypothetical protein